MVLYLFIVIFVFLILTFLGYIFHLFFHQHWAGPFFTAHMNHHIKQYPATDFISNKYRSAGNDSSLFLFFIVFSPFIIATIIFTITQVISMFLGIIILFEMAIIGFLNNSLHDSFHIRNTIWERFNFFKKLREKHITHHTDLSKNLGIFIFIWDRLFNTFKM